MTCQHNSPFFCIFHQKNRRMILGLFIILLLVSSEVTVLGDAEHYQSYSIRRYIILFDRPSLIKTLSDAVDTSEQTTVLLETKMMKNLKELFFDIADFHNDIKQRILNTTSQDCTFKLTSMLTWFVNGCIIETSFYSTITNLEHIPGIKKIIADDNRITIQSIEPQIFPSNKVNQDSTVYQNPTGRNVTIAIFDTGVDYTHPALNGNYLGGYDFVNDDPDPFDDHGHGTHVAGIAVGITPNANEWLGGTAPDAKFYSCKVMDEQGTGSISSFLQAFEYAIDPNQDGDPSDKVDIISISAGDHEGLSDDLLCQAANNAVRSGIVVVAAAGNSGPEEATITSPGIAEYVIAVGAASNTYEVASFSSRGSYSYGRVKPDIIAPGVQINSTWLSGSYKVLSGTSMATPYVAGYCARILEQHPEWKPLEVVMALRNQTSTLGNDMITQGYGYIDIQSYRELTENPPIAWIHNVNITDSNELTINGIVQGTNITSYQYYIHSIDKNTEWDQVQTVSSDGKQGDLGIMDISQYPAGTYLLQLQVTADTIVTTDHYFITLDQQNNQTAMKIYYPETILENIEFSVQIQTQKPIPILSIFLVPLKPPQIKIGSEFSLRAPSIFSEKIESTEGFLLIITPSSCTPLLTKKTITIINKD